MTQRMHPLLRTIFDTQSVHAADGRESPLRANLPELEGEILQRWVRDARPRSILEIGLAYGISSLFICDAIDDWNGVAYRIVDPHQLSDWQNIGRLNLERAGFAGRFELIEERAEICLPRLLGAGVQIDFAFIDGNHRFEHVMVDFFYVHRMLQTNGVIVFDDADRPGIAKVLSLLRTYPFYEEVPLPTDIAGRRELRLRRMMNVLPARIVAFRKTGPDMRPSHWYVDF